MVWPNGAIRVRVEDYCSKNNELGLCSGDMHHFNIAKNGSSYIMGNSDLANITFRMVSCDYSDNVKIIVPGNSKYIYTYDKDQQLLTVYNSEPTRENKANTNSYQLVYMFSLKFNINWVNVYDVDIPWEWNKPELYVLSSKWVNKLPLYEYLEALK